MRRRNSPAFQEAAEAARKRQEADQRDRMMRERRVQAEARVARCETVLRDAEELCLSNTEIESRKRAYDTAVKDLEELRRSNTARTVAKGECPKCGKHIGRGVFFHMKGCNGVNTSNAQSRTG